MRIVILTPSFLPVIGGAEIIAYELAKWLSSAHQIVILTPVVSGYVPSKGELSDGYLNSQNFKVRRFHDRINLRKFSRLGGIFGMIPPFSFSAIPALLRVVKEFRPHLINVHYAIPTGLAALVAQRLGNIPVVLTLIGRDVPGPGMPGIWNYWVRMVSKRVREVVYISGYCREALYGKGNTSRGQVLYAGVDTNYYAKGDRYLVRERLGISSEKTVLFSLQRLNKWKRIEVLINMMSYLILREPNVILIIGGKGSKDKVLKKLVFKLGISQNVIFTGYIKNSELPDYFAASDIFVFHSVFETFGIVLTQAMAAGKPIVSVKSTAIPEVVHHGVNGLLVEPNDPRMFAEAVFKLIDDEALRKSFSEQGRKIAIEKFELSNTLRRYEELFRGIISQKGNAN